MNRVAEGTRKLRRAIALAGLLLVLFFALRMVHSYRYLADASAQPRDAAVELRGWMTVPYVATAYGVPEAPLFVRLGVPAGEHRDTSLRDLVAARDPASRAATMASLGRLVEELRGTSPRRDLRR